MSNQHKQLKLLVSPEQKCHSDKVECVMLIKEEKKSMTQFLKCFLNSLFIYPKE